MDSFDIDHEDNEDCPCGPEVHALMDGNGSVISWLYTHHRLDGQT